MTEYEITERTAAGVRALSKYNWPLVGFVAANGWEPNMLTICGKPIWFMSDLLIFRPYSDFPCPLYPIFLDKDEESIDPAAIFAKAFLEYEVKL